MKFFVIGGTGSIGSVLVPAAMSQGHQVVALSRNQTATRRLEALGATVARGDMTEPEQWIPQASQADVLVQLGATATKRSNAKWLTTGGDANRIATEGLIDAAIRNDTRPVVITASGVMVAGHHGDKWIDEETPDVPHPLTNYWGPNETQLERGRAAGVSATALRFGQVYDSNPESTFGKFFLAMAAKGKFRYMGDGTNYFPFVHVDDAVDAILRAGERRPTRDMIYVVEDDIEPMASSVAALMEPFGHKTKGVPLFAGRMAAGKPMAAGFSGSYRPRNSLAKGELGWQPTRPSFAEAITDVVERYKKTTSIE